MPPDPVTPAIGTRLPGDPRRPAHALRQVKNVGHTRESRKSPRCGLCVDTRPRRVQALYARVVQDGARANTRRASHKFGRSERVGLRCIAGTRDRIAPRRGGVQLRSSPDFHTLRCGGLREQMRKPVVTVCALDEGVRGALHPHCRVQASPEQF